MHATPEIEFPADLPIALTAEVLSERVLRLRIGGRGGPSYLPPREWPGGGASETPGEIATARLGLRFDADALRVAFRSDGRDRLRLVLAATELSPRLRLRFDIVGEQHFYGLGQGGHGFDRLGISRRLWNAHVNHGPGGDIAIPLLLSTGGYGLFFDNPRFALIDAGRTHDRVSFDYECDGDGFDLYFLGGEDLRHTVIAASGLLGRAPLPPRWALGFMQSSRHFSGPDEVRGLATTLRDKALPCDALIFLSTYSDGKGWNEAVGSLEFERSTFPEPEAMLAAFRAQNFRVITHEYPVIHERSPDHAEAASRGYLLKEDGYDRVVPAARPSDNFYEGQRFIDFSQEKAGAWWWEKHRRLVALGVEGWWLDGGEGPTAPGILRDPDRAGLHNRFDLYRHAAFAEGEARDNPDRRPFLLCRSGGPGMQRFGAGTWSGDINRTWATFAAQTALGLNMGMSGVPLWGTDIGGFYPSSPPDPELFVRWFQFGAFCPIFRLHGWRWREHLPWSYGPEVEAIVRTYLELRYRLIPTLYALVRDSLQIGLPIMRPLVLNYPEDAETWELGSQFLLFDDLLVAPVTAPGASHWPVYLPAGIWHDFWTHETYIGGRGVSVATPLDRIPLFVRAGAILALGPVVQHLRGYAPATITLLVYPERKSATYPEGVTVFPLYEDDGETNAYQTGSHALTFIECDADAGRANVRIGPPQGDMSLIPADRRYALQVRVPGPPKSVRLNGSEMSAADWRYDGVFVHVASVGAPAEVTVGY